MRAERRREGAKVCGNGGVRDIRDAPFTELIGNNCINIGNAGTDINKQPLNLSTTSSRQNVVEWCVIKNIFDLIILPHTDAICQMRINNISNNHVTMAANEHASII